MSCYCQTQGYNCNQGRECPLRAAQAETNPTVRRYPRSLSDAFPDVRASAGVRYRSGLVRRMLQWLRS